MGALWNKPKFRGLFYQAAALLAVVLSVWWLADNTAENLTRQGKTAGFGFLQDESGFRPSFHLIEHSETSSYTNLFAVGVLNTLLVSALGIILATALGFVIGVARLSPNYLARKIAEWYVEIFRNIPLLLQIFLWYFAVFLLLPAPRESINIADAVYLNQRGFYLPRPEFGGGWAWILAAFIIAAVGVFMLARWAHLRQMKTGRQFPVFASGGALLAGLPLLAFVAAGFPLSWNLPQLRGFNFAPDRGLGLPVEFAALLLALSIYTASFIAEIVRAGILSVARGQFEAAYSLGLRRGLALRLVAIPQALRVIVPPLTNQYLNLTKNSSLAVAIAYPEVVSVFAGTALNQSGHEIEIIFIAMMFYLSVSLAIAAAMNWYNRRYALIKER
jgi:general L-amino acid transport system permease protein